MGELSAPRGLGVVEEFARLQWRLPRSGAEGEHSGRTAERRLLPNSRYPDRWAVAEGLLPLVREEIRRLVEAGCAEITIDEPSMSCYAHKEDTSRMVDLFNRTAEPAWGRSRLSTHLCFGNYKARAVGPRRYAPMFPDFLRFTVDELHLEMASREFAELECIAEIAESHDVSVGIWM